MAKKMNKRVLLAKIESVYGTDPTPTGAANAILVRNLNIVPVEGEYDPRNLIRPYYGNSESLLGAAYRTCEFEVELQASGTAGTAPAWGPLIRACAFGETIVATTSVTYAPISSAEESLTLYYNVDGILMKMTGARGTVALDMTVKKIPVLKFKYVGLETAATDTAAATPTYTAWIKPKTVNNTNTSAFAIHSHGGKLEMLSIDAANKTPFRALVGSETVEMVDRQMVGKCKIELPTIAAKDFFTIAKNATLGALTIQHGQTAGGICTISSSVVQVTKPSISESDNIAMLEMDLAFVPSSSGNDELSIALT
jgi:hypothetical protein